MATRKPAPRLLRYLVISQTHGTLRSSRKITSAFRGRQSHFRCAKIGTVPKLFSGESQATSQMSSHKACRRASLLRDPFRLLTG